MLKASSRISLVLLLALSIAGMGTSRAKAEPTLAETIQYLNTYRSQNPAFKVFEYLHFGGTKIGVLYVGAQEVDGFAEVYDVRDIIPSFTIKKVKNNYWIGLKCRNGNCVDSVEYRNCTGRTANSCRRDPDPPLIENRRPSTGFSIRSDRIGNAKRAVHHMFKNLLGN